MSNSLRTCLSVNVNKVALLRNTRHLGEPSVVRASRICLEAGADGITVHPRPDERHIRRTDVYDIADKENGDKQSIALIPNLKTSQMCDELVGEEPVRFNCAFSNKFKKWIPLEKA